MIASIGALLCAVLCVALVICIAVSQPEIKPRAERRMPVLDRPLLTREQKLQGQETGWLTFDCCGMHYVVSWEWFRLNHKEYLWKE